MAKTYTARLRCLECWGDPVEIQRRQAKRREDGHTKHLWCSRCEDTTAHTEVVE